MVAGGDGLLLVLHDHLDGLAHVGKVADDQVFLRWAAARCKGWIQGIGRGSVELMGIVQETTDQQACVGVCVSVCVCE